MVIPRSEDASRLFEQVKHHVVEGIRSGAFGLGSVLPPVERIAEELGCSIGTVRRGLTELAQEGIVQRIQGRGTVVKRRPNSGRVALVLSSDEHSNLLLQTPMYRALADERFQVEVVVVASTASRDVAHACDRLEGMLEAADRVGCVVLVEPHYWEMNAVDWHRFDQLVRRFPTRAGFCIDTHACLAATPVVAVDHEQYAELAMRHLLDLGHRRIAATAGVDVRDDGSWADRSAKVCQRLVAAAGGTFFPHLIGQGLDHLVQLVRRDGVTAIWTHVDHYAALAIAHFRQHRLVVPRDVSLIGRFDTPWSQQTDPPLTSISLDPALVASTIAGMLRKPPAATRHVPGAPAEMIPGRIVARASTAAPPAP